MATITSREKPDHYGDIAQRMTGFLAGLRGQDVIDKLDTLDLYVWEMRRRAEPAAVREVREAGEVELDEARALIRELEAEQAHR